MGAVRQSDPMAIDRTHPSSAVTGASFTPASLAAACGGRLIRSGERPIHGGAVDSRRIQGGEIFFALRGERTDGHRFLGAAAAAGASALVVGELPDDATLEALHGPGGAPTIVAVDDPARALIETAAAWRARLDPFVVGITGSYGKTSTKEQVAEVLSVSRRVRRSEGNENNEIGLPLTLLRATPEDEALVLEMGLYREGEIALLARIARPHVGIVTAVRGVHLSRAGSLDAIERGKRELIDSLAPGGTAILNADDERVTRWSPPAGVATLRYGFSPDADVRAEAVEPMGAGGMRFRLLLPGVARVAQTPALGRHSVHNALAAAAAALVAGMDPDAIVAGIARGARALHRTTLLPAGDRLVLDDSYNASPDTMVAALDLLATLPGRHVAVLGEMLELGEGSAAGHAQAGRHAARTADLLIAVGPGALPIAAAAREAGMAPELVVEVADRDAALHVLLSRGTPGETILVKASRGAELDLLVADLVRLLGGAGGRA